MTSAWVEDKTERGLCWSRQLGNDEAAFYWDGEIRGACDIIQNLRVAVDKRSDILESHSGAIESAWKRVKRRHPLLAARIVENSPSDIRYVIEKQRVLSVLPGEIIEETLFQPDKLSNIVDQYSNGPRVVSSDMLARLHVVSLPSLSNNQSGHCHYQLFICISHAVADVFSALSVTRTLLTFLTTLDSVEDNHSIATRLNFLASTDQLLVHRSMSLARRRWRLAIAQIILSCRAKRTIGGHTLPNAITQKSYFQPAVARKHQVTLDRRTTFSIMKTCRREGITFGQALHVLCQLAQTEILRRLYNRGKLSPNEWDHRLIQPMHYFGPINIRPHLNRHWLAQGGAKEVIATGAIYRCTLPFMPAKEPLSSTSMSRSRFFHRCRGVKQQVDAYLQHPLLSEMSLCVAMQHREERLRFATAWRAVQASGIQVLEAQPASTEEPAIPMVISNQISTIGSLKDILPIHYPRTSPILHLTSITAEARPFPTQFYLSAATHDDMLHFVVFWDANVYEDEMAKQWAEAVAQFSKTFMGSEVEVSARL